jgi:hypothetical protein
MPTAYFSNDQVVIRDSKLTREATGARATSKPDGGLKYAGQNFKALHRLIRLRHG